MITEDAVEKLKELNLDINTFRLKPDKDEQVHSNKRH